MRALLAVTTVLLLALLLSPFQVDSKDGTTESRCSTLSTRSNVVFFDDFEAATSPWTHGGEMDEWELGAPNGSNPDDPGPPSAHSGAQLWGTDLNATYDTGCDQWLRSPVIDLRNFTDATLDLWLWFDVTAMMSDAPLESPPDQLLLEIAEDPYDIWKTLAAFNHSSYQENTWINPGFDVTEHAGNEFRIRLRLEDLSPEYTDNGAYVDDIRVQATPLPYLDIGIAGLSIEPVCEIERPLNLTISLKNKGLNALSNVELTISLEDSLGSMVKQETTMSPTIPPRSSKSVYWQWCCDRYAILSINVEAVLTGDEDPSDNMLGTTTRVAHFFYSSDLEQDPQTAQWTQSVLKGSPLWHIKSSKAMAHSGARSWWCGNDTSGKYDNGQDDRLISPMIDLSLAKSANLVLWTNYSFEDETSAWDGGLVEITTDGGRSFESITPKGGYDDTITMDGGNTLKGMHAFAHSSKGWRQVEFVLNGHIGNLVNISLRMGSDLWDNNVGWFVDDLWVFGEAIPDNGSSDFSPDPISRLKVKSIGDGNITLSWEVCSAADFDHYNIYVERGNFTDIWGIFPYDVVKNRTLSHYVITGLTNGIRYYIAVTAVDFAGNENASVVTVSSTPSAAVSQNHPPVAKASCSPARKVNDLIYFYSRESYDPDTNDKIASYEWDFGDGSTSDDEEPQHRFGETGVYNVTLTLTDNYGGQGEDHIIIQVKPEDQNLLSNKFAPIMMIAAIVILIAFLGIFFYFYKTRRTHKKVYAKRKAVNAVILADDEPEVASRHSAFDGSSAGEGRGRGGRSAIQRFLGKGDTRRAGDDDEEVEFTPRAAVKFHKEHEHRDHKITVEDDAQRDFPIYIREPKPKTARVVRDHAQNHERHPSHDHQARKEHHNNECVMTMIKCPCCCQIIKIKAPKDMLDAKEPIHIKCPICEQEGDISW